jgi:hypothetical protein
LVSSKPKGENAHYGLLLPVEVPIPTSMGPSSSSTQYDHSLTPASTSLKCKHLFDAIALESSSSKRSRATSNMGMGKLKDMMGQVVGFITNLKKSPSSAPLPLPLALPPVLSPLSLTHSLLPQEQVIICFNTFIRKAKEHNDRWLTELQVVTMIKKFQASEMTARYYLSVTEGVKLGEDKGVICLWVETELRSDVSMGADLLLL